MKAQLQLFGAAHLAMLAAVPAIAGILAVAHRKLPAAKTIRMGVAVALVVNTILFYGWRIETGVLAFPNGLPLELCDLSLFLTIVALFTLKPWSFDLAYYWALAGAGMALLTPNLTDPFPSFGSVEFFITHGLTVCGVLYLVWSGQARPRRWSVARAMIGINIVALFDGPFDAIFGTDYFFLRAKPVNPSLLDYLGPWPLYIVSTEGVALILFLLLYLPVRRAAKAVAAEPEAIMVEE